MELWGVATEGGYKQQRNSTNSKPTTVSMTSDGSTTPPLLFPSILRLTSSDTAFSVMDFTFIASQRGRGAGCQSQAIGQDSRDGLKANRSSRSRGFKTRIVNFLGSKDFQGANIDQSQHIEQNSNSLAEPNNKNQRWERVPAPDEPRWDFHSEIDPQSSHILLEASRVPSELTVRKGWAAK
jgi:hypothetical protein